jgi:prepilin signal peptidase PulO-like enzyme (type II secretory pathway)
MIKIISLVAAFIAGTCTGSFLYTLALRYSSGELQKKTMHALFSRSKCPVCLNTISPLYLVPIIGYCYLRGRCRKCGGSISIIYPAMEIGYGMLAVLFVWKLGITAYSVNAYLLAGIAISIAVVDIKTMTIPNTLIIALVVLSAYPVILNYDISDNLFGCLVLFIIFIVILLIFPGSFGTGDLKLASAVGFISGFELSIVILEISLITGAVAGIIYSFVTKQSLRTKIPFAPFIAVGFITSVLYGRELLLVYYRIFY